MTKKLPYLLAFALCAALLLVACGGAGDNAANTSNTKAGNTNAGGTTTASTGDKIGVPECDDFIAKYESCINSKVPESLRASVKSTLDATRNAWRQAAANAATRSTLAAQCKTAHDQTKASMSAYGCSW